MSHEFDIAVVGLSCRLPGARNVDEFWDNLVAGVESITRFSLEELSEAGVSASCLNSPNYVRAAPILDEPGHFDAAFFGFTPLEARTMDPQHRVLLELAHEALEHAGCDPDRFDGRVGVFTGMAMNTYFMHNGLSGRFAEDYIPTLIVNDKDFLSTRISYKLNLKGPSITVQTACSTSLVAVHLACQSLLSRESDMALAGAVSIRVPHRAGYFVDGGGVVSPDGQVRAFDAKANGTVFGSGGGVLILKRLADALDQGDAIHALIKGSAVNNDGAEKAGYTAPGVYSQADAVIEALANAGVEADSIGYIEAHGSGTPVGDPIEIAALTQAFRASTRRSGFCGIGSVKTNVGHLDAAAGMAGLIKTVLALKHRKLPPSLHFTEPNPEIDFPATPFYVNARLQDWTGPAPLRAGVMSTGMGGTNAHVILEEAPTGSRETSEERPQLLVVSAKSEFALRQAASRLREFLQRETSAALEDVAHTLQVGRKAFPYRQCLVARTRLDAVQGLETERASGVVSGKAAATIRGTRVFLFPGIGDHYVGMGHGLYEAFEVFRQAVDHCAQTLEPLLGVDVRDVLYPASRSWLAREPRQGIDLKRMLGRGSREPADADTIRLNQTLHAQPALFTIEYALAKLWASFGIQPDAMVGHSMGEYVAATLAGVMSLEDALRLISVRARLVNELPQGRMVAVMLAEQDLLPLLPPRLSISLINGPALCVVAGPVTDVEAFERTLDEKSILWRPVQNAHAFHSSMLEPMAAPFEAEVRRVALHPPKVPFISNVTGSWITASQATDPAYWALHAHRPARFNDALSAVWKHPDPVLVEAGPGRTLGVLALQHPAKDPARHPAHASSLRHHYEGHPDAEYLLQNAGTLWVSGLDVRWDSLRPGRRPRKIPLPTYPFERSRYWMDGPSEDAIPPSRDKERSARLSLDDWFHVPTWRRTPFPIQSMDGFDPRDATWLIVGEPSDGTASLKRRLDQLGVPAVSICYGGAFARHQDASYHISNSGSADYVMVLRQAYAGLNRPLNVIHMGCWTARAPLPAGLRSVDDQCSGFHSLHFMAQALGELNVTAPVTIGVLSNGIHEVMGDEWIDPGKATVLGPCGVIPKEYPNIRCFNLDLPDGMGRPDFGDAVADNILAEFAEPKLSNVIAYRGSYRWERDYEPIRLPCAPQPGSTDSSRTKRRLKSGGVYLITGGTGGLGLVLSRYLAEEFQAKIVLTRKSPFPDKAKWRGTIQSGEAPEEILQTLECLLELERLGAEVEVMVAEVSDMERMRSVLEYAGTRFGKIDGVIHAAGIVRAGLIQTKSREMADAVLGPKVRGTMVLHDLLKDYPLDFLILFSSMRSVTTPLGESDYSAANAFLDAFSLYANASTKLPTLTINWPGWREVGILARLDSPAGLEKWKEAELQRAIFPAEGLEVFKRALHSDLKQLIVSPDNLRELLEESRHPFDPARYLPADRTMQTGSDSDPSPFDTIHSPKDEVESVVATIWREVFGLSHIGANDSFSALGGHSLLAMQIVGKIRSIYQMNISLKDFFDAPTIAQLSSLLQDRIVREIESLSEDQVRRLMSAE